jgi:hypothetical protein
LLNTESAAVFSRPFKDSRTAAIYFCRSAASESAVVEYPEHSFLIGGKSHEQDACSQQHQYNYNEFHFSGFTKNNTENR